MYCGDTVIHVVCIVGYSYTCCMYCGIQLYNHVVCIVGYSYTCSMHCGDTVSMYCGIQLYM